MKFRIYLVMCLFFCFSTTRSQVEKSNPYPMIGDDAPGFIAETTSGLLNFPADYGNKWKIIFSHPRDFIPVCSSVILELAQMQNDFAKLNVKLVILSTDTLYEHIMWERALEKTS